LSLDDAPAFEALSYTWGISPPSIPLEVTGSRILVTSAVEEFLFHQRSFFRSKLFWIDSVCINQNDDVEKTEQLPLMTEIYRRARLVIVWLGPPA
ncbi:heterokaryon incompatibility, partial [Leptodontidium sp. 2 PMI_412]